MKSRITLSLIVLVAVFLGGLFLYLKPFYDFLSDTLHISLTQTLFGNGALKTYNDQLNILILGIAGGRYDGPNLSDSIVVANYNFKTNQITTISVPRDIWSDTLQDKINSAYAYGEAKEPGKGGFALAKAEVAGIIGMPIQYAAVIDFDKFKELIDYLGGVDVQVENSFTDNLFPITGKENDLCNGDPEYRCRYETISFTKGLSHMNGETALKFVRSRHADGAEGTDFARENRQQKVIAAVKNKILAIAKRRNLNQLEALYNLLDQLVKRDITNQQAAIIAKNIFLRGNLEQKTITLAEDFFTVPDYSNRYNGMWVLIPHGGSFTAVQSYISCNLNDEGNCFRFQPSPTPSPLP